MAKILLDFVFPISVIASIPAASTAFLKQVCVIAKPKAGQEANVGQVFECTSMTAVAARTDNTNAQQLFNAGMTKVYVLLTNDLGLDEALEAEAGEFYTVLISDDFDEDDFVSEVAELTKASLTFTADTAGPGGNDISITFENDGSGGFETVEVTGKAILVHMEPGVSTNNQVKAALDGSAAAAALISVTVAGGAGGTAVAAAFAEDFLEGGTGVDVGAFEGVIGVSSNDLTFLGEQAAISNRCVFYGNSTNKAKNLFYAFGKLLSNLLNWTNQQYISMPVNDDIDDLGEANSLFDDRVSFVIHDDEFSNRLALFAAGGKAIVAPYIEKNLRVDLQSAALTWIAANQPAYTLKNATLLETRLQEDVMNAKYIALPLQWLTAGTVEIRLIEDNFVGAGFIDIAEPKALWRILGEMRQTL